MEAYFPSKLKYYTSNTAVLQILFRVLFPLNWFRRLEFSIGLSVQDLSILRLFWGFVFSYYSLSFSQISGDTWK